MADIRVQASPFDAGREIARLSAVDGLGGIGCFVGVVRGTAGGRALASLTLEYYPGMTERALAGIAAEAERRWELLACTVVHRVGTLQPGEPIVLVLAGAAHREPCLQATSFLIDWLKTRAPFWKREAFVDGTAAWVAARDDDETAAAAWR